MKALPAAFTDHYVAVLRVTVHGLDIQRGWRPWKMYTQSMDDNNVKLRIRQECKQ
jgi:hypothetical protein